MGKERSKMKQTCVLCGYRCVSLDGAKVKRQIQDSDRRLHLSQISIKDCRARKVIKEEGVAPEVARVLANLGESIKNKNN